MAQDEVASAHQRLQALHAPLTSDDVEAEAQLLALEKSGKLTLKNVEIHKGRWWRLHYPEASPQEAYALLSNGLPKLRLEMDANISRCRFLYPDFDSDNTYASFHFVASEFQEKETKIEKIFLKDPKRTKTHAGIRLLANIVEFSAKHGVHHFPVDTMDIGAYMDIKLGMLPAMEGQRCWRELRDGPGKSYTREENDPYDGLKSRYQAILADNPNLDSAAKKIIEHARASDDPKAIRPLAECPYKIHTPATIRHLVREEDQKMIGLGKAFLIGQRWKGGLDFDDPDSRQMFTTYMESHGIHMLAEMERAFGRATDSPTTRRP